MSKSPFYSVYINSNKRDITNLITSFTHEDCVKEDDLVKLTMMGKTIALIDDKDLVEGAEIVFQYGYLGGKQSGKRLAIIHDIDYSYSKTIDIVVTAYDKGRLMKKNDSTKIWKNKTSSQIAEDIAKQYGFNVNITPTKKVHTSLPQGNRTDFELLQYLTTIEENIIDFFVKGDTLSFKKNDLSETSSRTFTYANGDGPVKRFKVTQKDKKGSNETKVGDSKVNDSNASDKNKLGDKLNYYNADAIKVNPDAETVAKQTGKSIPIPTDSKSEAENVANKAKRDAELDSITATLEIEGDPLILSDTIISMAGVAKKHSGNWYIKKVTHRVGKDGYSTTIESGRNPGEGSKNKSSGPNDASKKEKLNVYDENANKLS